MPRISGQQRRFMPDFAMINVEKYDYDLQKRWVDSSIHLSKNNHHLMIGIQDVGMIDLILRKKEREVIDLECHGLPENILAQINPYRLNILCSLSKFWLFGLYETLRLLHQESWSKKGQKKRRPANFPDEYSELNHVYWDVQLARMPLAKHEAAKLKNFFFWPGLRYYPDVGCCGWEVYCKKIEGRKQVCRTAIADSFLISCENIARK